MKIILSRKGFDSSAGGSPSPVLPDGRMLSLPIPDPQSTIRYGDIRWQGRDLGALVSGLTDGRIAPHDRAHLDPDLVPASLPRQPGWRPLLGQAGAAQGHLDRQGVGAGDLFLFFGLFRKTVQTGGALAWDRASPRRHAIWGWLQVGEALRVSECGTEAYGWAAYHPHFQRDPGEPNNTIYVARRRLALPGQFGGERSGAGVFDRFSSPLMLTARDSDLPSEWRLPPGLYPRAGKSPLSYHANPGRWRQGNDGVRLRSVARGQEFVLDTRAFPEALEWAAALFRSGGAFHPG